MSHEILDYELNDSVAILRIDDGKANAVSHAFIAAVNAGLDRAAQEARAAVIVGRLRRFSAGFDLSVVQDGGPEAARGLVTAGAEMLMKMYVHPQPLLIACTGHAIAAGALMLLAADTRIGAEGDFKIGLNEVAIGMPLPHFLVTLARERLSKRHLTQATIQARLYDPAGAVDAGFLDRACPADTLVEETLKEADQLAKLRPEVYRDAKIRNRGAVADEVLDTLHDDLKRLLPGS
jgi:enoyl-CoA hydratase